MNDMPPRPIKNPRLILRSWTERPTRHWFCRCDVCGKRRIYADIHEVHGSEEEDEPNVWWYQCSRCLVAHFSWLNRFETELRTAYAALCGEDSSGPCPVEVMP